MNDPEVARLRRLRNAALLVRKIARELSAMRCAASDPLLVGVAHASWRIVRTVSGRLKAHPYVRYQKGASLGALLAHSLMAQLLVLTTGTRPKALAACAGFLRQLMRQLDDARALTWAADLSDAFGRSQAELDALMDAIEREIRSSTPVPSRSNSVPSRDTPPTARGTAAVVPAAAHLAPPRMSEDWPYLAF